MGRHYAAVLGCLAFTVMVARGIVHGGGVVGTIEMALWSLAGFAILGFVAGNLGDFIVAEAVRSRFEAEIKAHEKT